jgi:hypothetical protein
MLTSVFLRSRIAELLAKLRFGPRGKQRSGASLPQSAPRFRPGLEALEDRLTPSVY